MERRTNQRDALPMRTVALACLLSSGCSWVLMEKPPESPVRGQPIHCTASRGWAVVDLAFAVSDVATAVWISELDTALNTDTNKPLVVGLGFEALLHGLSALSGIDRADRCSTMRDEYETQPVVVVPVARPAAVVNKDERKVVIGDRPLFCNITAEDVGLCFLQQEACDADMMSTGSGMCEQRNAGSCFNATKTLDGTKATVCAVSISDCEARLKTYAENPDYTVTKCGIYRVGQR
jgi:hypothetical protein